VGSLTPATGGTVDGIAALLMVNGNEPASGSDVLNVDDTGDAGPNTGTLTATTITGLGMAGSITYGTIETLNIGLGAGSDTFTIESTHAGTTRLDTNAGDDTVHVLTSAGETTVNSGDDQDTVNVQTIGAATIVNAGSGDDTINVGSLAPATGGTLDGIAALLTVNGSDPDSGSDILNIDDTGDVDPNTGTLTANTITGLDMAGSITYGTIEALNIGLGSGSDTFTVESTHAGTTQLDTGAGNDVVTISVDAATDGPLTVNLQEGDDLLDASGSSLGLVISGGEGGDVINGGSGADIIFGDQEGDPSLGGADVIHGKGGDDTLYGGGGDDEMYGGLGNDALFGQDGNDVLLGDVGQVMGAAGYNLIGSPHKDVLLTDVAHVAGELPLNLEGLPAVSEATVDALLSADRVLLVGRLNADGSTDSRALLLELVADGNDALSGGDGDDALFGQRGDDMLDGDAGDDLLSGGTGNDRAHGGSGDDTVVGDELYIDSAAAIVPNVSHGLLVDGTVVVPAVQTVPGATPNAVARPAVCIRIWRERLAAGCRRRRRVPGVRLGGH
jgi:Ca2+-binding RTX toxin-like protein